MVNRMKKRGRPEFNVSRKTPGGRIRHERQRRGMSIVELARRSGYTRGWILQLERNDAELTPRARRLIEAALAAVDNAQKGNDVPAASSTDAPSPREQPQ